MPKRTEGGSARSPSEFFTNSDWVRFQALLSNAEDTMRELGRARGMVPLADIRGNWPARRLQHRRIVSVFEVRLQLNPKFLEDQREFFELSSVRYRDLWWFGGKIQSWKVHGQFTFENVADGQLLRRAIEGVLDTEGVT